jgi:hypothetical protein
VLLDFSLTVYKGVTCILAILLILFVFINTGNYWGTLSNGTSCLGCGFQETYINCADISIGMSSEIDIRKINSPKTGPTHSSHISKRTTDMSPHLLAMLNYTRDGEREECRRCYAVPTWNHYPGMDDWCDVNCRKGNCPPCRCYCGCPATDFQNP